MELIQLDATSGNPLYMQLYTYIKQAIEQNQLSEGDKLPSIRGLAASLSISKITVEKAYQQLMSEGYILNSNRSRYLVNKFEVMTIKRSVVPRQICDTKQQSEKNQKILYDFASGEMDIGGFDFSLWKRYINKVLLDKERLVGYGHVQGEAELRVEIAKYIRDSRGVNARQEQIIIGPGIQSLLNTLCSLLKSEANSIAFEDPGFKNGRRIFANYAFTIRAIPMKKDGIDINQLLHSGAKLAYVSPSHQFPTGYIMPAGKRVQLLNWAERVNGIIIEDDYDSEFRYFGRPIPALKGLDNGEAVVYLGSLSKVIPPSIRISYMVLPEKLLVGFQQNAALYNQATSTLEQLALAQFMADGCLERQIRRLRKLYYGKKGMLVDAVKGILGNHVEIEGAESGLYIILTIKSKLEAKQLVTQALGKGCRVASVQDYYLQNTPENTSRILLYFSKIPANEIEAAVRRLRDAWFG
ncbi:PLP-dependent aminotransferase family protein [Sporomusa sp. KB1]|jgi:GntR family transcriptional regulator/MocR family aminotransferase|uniref:MocR-like pyridoxine biosynthesis transcription factor PdxR n=1 Tax=Sporomusa sp. KB1 TaxID=943346 RepID=UPI00119DD2AD|nr:PLP-dependent aminotransferase family protein [Sporomusa sp. KB1]TWH47645.1 GntR family transcriptional regulator/MocR family aminotransferase [Sporomusa sp. KB1]